MNRLQEAELDLLKMFVEICEKLQLKYYLVCGTALGAAKYQGFIPWDDDIDVALCREDYNVFIKEAQKYLPDNIFLQNYITDSEFPHIFSKLRNSNTTFIEKNKANLRINHGVYIDVFPIDGYPAANREQKCLEFKKKTYLRKLACKFNVPRNFKSKVSFIVHRMFGYHKRSAYVLQKYEKMISRYSIDDSDIWCNHGNWQGKLEYAPKWHYGQGTWANFEGMRVRIPENYDEYLTQKYGDWRADLPENEKQGHHYYTICDLDTPYTEYMLKNGK